VNTKEWDDPSAYSLSWASLELTRTAQASTKITRLNGAGCTSLKTLLLSGMVGHSLEYEPNTRSYDILSVPNNEEIAFVLELIDHIGQPALKVVESLIETSDTWDSIARNDFCR